MNWPQAVDAMMAGKHVRRVSESVRRQIRTPDGMPVYDNGTEPCHIALAWQVDGRPAHVFRGSSSLQLFQPSAESMSADDWITVNPLTMAPA
jgi:hypothetical protein